MASPFSVFRKNQKVMIAVLGVLAMFAFVFLPIMLQRMGMRGAAKNPVVVKSKYGDLTRFEVDALRRQHMRALQFLGQVAQAAREAGGTGYIAAMFRQRLGDASEDVVLDIWLRAKHAEEMGVVISEDAINGFIKEITENNENKGVSTFQLKQILGDMGITSMQLFEILRHEMMAIRAAQLFQISLQGTTPAQRWDYFKRLKQKATIEVAPIRVADYIAKVEDKPSDEQLRAFFEEHREAYPVPFLPDPGFRVPHRIAVNYLKADVDMELVTDEEVRAEYEENKEMWDTLRGLSTTESLGDTTEDTPTDETPAEDKPAEDTPDADAPTEEQPENEATDAPPAASTDAEPETEAPAEDADTEPAADGETSGETSATRHDSPFRLVSMLQEEDKSAEQDTGDDTSASDEKETPDEMAETNETEGSTEPAETEGPEADGEPAGPSEPAEPSVEEPSIEEPAVEPPKEQPADDDIVSTSTGMAIRRQLAGQRLQAIMSDLQDQISSYFRKRKRHEADAISEKGPKVDLAAMDAAFAKEIRAAGEEAGLTWGEAPDPQAGIGPMMSNFESQEFEIGRTFIQTPEQRILFVQYAFEENRQLYETAISFDNQGNTYLFWKVADGKERIPKFEDKGVKDRVLRAWKMQKARELATQRAEALAEKARKDALRSLKDSIGSEPGVEVAKTDPFTWLTRGNVPATATQMPPARRTKLEPTVEMAGPEFMRTVFGLDKGEVAVAMNQPEEIAYVVRVSEVNPSEAVLLDQFEVDPFQTYADVARQDNLRTMQKWNELLREDAEFERVELPEEESTE